MPYTIAEKRKYTYDRFRFLAGSITKIVLYTHHYFIQFYRSLGVSQKFVKTVTKLSCFTQNITNHLIVLFQ